MAEPVAKEYGADSLRLYEMFMGPLEATKPWSMTGVNGVRGFLDRVWRMIVAERSETLELNPAVQSVPPTPEQNRVLHKTIAAVTARHRAAQFQYRHRANDGVHQFFHEGRGPAARGDGAVGTDPFTLCPAYCRRIVATAGPRPYTGFRAVAGSRSAVAQGRHDRGAGARSTASCAAKSSPRPAPTLPRWNRSARADAHMAAMLAGKTVVKVIVSPGPNGQFRH